MATRGYRVEIILNTEPVYVFRDCGTHSAETTARRCYEATKKLVSNDGPVQAVRLWDMQWKKPKLLDRFPEYI